MYFDEDPAPEAEEVAEDAAKEEADVPSL